MVNILPAKLPVGYQLAHDRQPTWRVGNPLVWGTGFTPPQWLLHNERISIRPNETGPEAYEREFSEPLPKNTFIVWINF
jgi:hypothetical protein